MSRGGNYDCAPPMVLCGFSSNSSRQAMARRLLATSRRKACAIYMLIATAAFILPFLDIAYCFLRTASSTQQALLYIHSAK